MPVATYFFSYLDYTNADKDDWVLKEGRHTVEIYGDLVILLNFAVDFLLLLGTNRIAGYSPNAGRSAIAAFVGGIYAGLCLLPGFRFFSGILWRTVILGVMSGIAFGLNPTAFRRTVLFILLSFALGGAALGLGHRSLGKLLGAALVVAALAGFGFHRRTPGGEMVPVTLWFQGKQVSAIALRDTGNTLRDPVTGQQVLIAGSDIAGILTGLTSDQLAHPVETFARISTPGFRLIPYRTVGQSGSMLLTIRCPKVRAGAWEGSMLVALAPDIISGTYQLLMGGA